jgi:hypothetical protein
MPVFSRILYLIFGVVLLTSCASRRTSLSASDLRSSHFNQAVLSGSYQSVSYKAGIDVFGKHLSGILFVKQTQPNSFRIVLLSEIGLSLMDFEITPDTSRLISCQDFINKPALIKVFQNDFEQLVKETKTIERVRERATRTHRTVKFVGDGKMMRMALNPETLKAERVKIKHGLFSGVNYSFSYPESSFPSVIHINHVGLPVKIELKHLNTTL